MLILKSANLALRFFLELCALAALAYWGFHLDQGIVWKGIAGLGAPLATTFSGAFVPEPRCSCLNRGGLGWNWPFLGWPPPVWRPLNGRCWPGC
ncbi:MAG: DUF2568 domain-containing protein [Chloroflexi bacterium]|nr:DUF2568 domain-containing protein [Chloroflexota bacterium]